MNNSYALGFVKRAQEYGLSEHQAIQLAKQANLGEILETVKEYGGKGLNKLKGMIAGYPTPFSGDVGPEQAETASQLLASQGLPELKDLAFGKALGMGWDRLDPTAKGALIGGGVGLAGGALIPSEDEYGETHRLRNALLGGVGGAAVGGGAVYGAPYAKEKLTAAQKKLMEKYEAVKGALNGTWQPTPKSLGKKQYPIPSSVEDEMDEMV